MRDFIAQCRREWKRLRVPDSVANEMAADLAADLAEAEAEGVTAEEVLGTSAYDPRSFAASWAASRGVIPPARPTENRLRKPLMVAAIATLAVLALMGSALALLASHAGSLTAAPAWIARSTGSEQVMPVPLGARPAVHVGASGAHAIGWALLVLAMVGIIASTWLWSAWARSRPHVASG
jgi:hypothetical protein